MSILSLPIPTSKPTTPAGDWQANAAKLALWALTHLVNRTDAYGVHKPDGTRATGRGDLGVFRLQDHFSGRSIIGVHLISLANTCNSVKVDIDAHGDQDDVDQVAKQNLATALELCRRALALGFHPLLTDSNGRGGYHLELIFSKPIPSADAYHFGLWLCRGFNPNKSGGIEFFPKRPDRNTEKGFGGGWVRLYGKHHKRDHWTTVYDFTRAGVGLDPWLDEQAAIAAILAHTGDDPALLEAVRAEFTPKQAPPATPPATPPARPAVPPVPFGPRPANALDRARAYLSKMEAPDPRPEHPMDASTQLLKGAAVCVGFDVSEGEALDLLRNWSTIHAYPEAELCRKLREAERGKPRGWLLERDKLQIPCGYIAVDPSCPDSSYPNSGDSSQTRDNANNPQGNCNPSAAYAHFLEPPEPMDPWSCPHVIGIAGVFHGSPCLIPAPCHKRDCPVCGPYSRASMMHRFSTWIDRHEGQLYADTVPDFDWPAVVKDMRRRAAKLGVPLRFVSVRLDEGATLERDSRGVYVAFVPDSPPALVVISSVPLYADVARPVEKAEAIDVLGEALVSASLDPRPVSSCRAWGPITGDPEPEEKASRVPGVASPAAFTATVKVWGNEVADAKGSVLKCKRDGLFLGDDGQLDAVMQADFWREAQLWADCGPEAAADFHRTAAARRKGNCRHVHTTAHDLLNGRAAVKCNDCGRYIGTGGAGP